MIKLIKRNKIYILSFILPILALLLCFIRLKVFPFGDNTIFTIDLNAQYSDFFLLYKDIISGSRNLFYSFGNNLGGSLIDLFSYYLASPFNLIILFFSRDNITEAILSILLLKIACSGLTFSIFLSKKFKTSDPLIIAFSLSYALMSYNIVYYFNIMWLDGVIWLPIIALGIEKMIKNNRPGLFYISLAVAVFSNWYVGYMLCIFSFLYSLYILFSEDIKNKFSQLGRLILYGCLSVGSTAFLLMPSFILFTGLDNRFSWENFNFEVNFSLFDLFSKFILGAFDVYQITSYKISEEYLNLPNIFCGGFSLLFIVLYFCSKKIELKEKFIDFLFLIVFLLSFLFNLLNSVWNIGVLNAWFPYRYSFIFSFVFILISYKSYLNIKYLNMRELPKILLGILFLMMLIEKFEYPYINNYHIAIAFLFILLLGILIIIKARYKSYLINTGIIGIVFIEMFVNALFILKDFYITDRNEYYNDISSCTQVMRVMPSDTVYNRTAYASDNFRYNAPLVLGFKGINNSSSTIKSSLSNFFERLGYTAVSPNIILYNGSMPVSDMLLSLKYIISEKQILDYPKINSISEINVFENPNALSLAFCASEDAFNTLPDKETVNPFEFQNILINNITGKSETYFYKTGEPAVFLNNLRKMDKSLEDKKDKEDKEESDSEYYEKLYNDSGVIEYDIKIPIGKEAFAFFPKKKVLKCKLYINDKECSDYFSPDNYGIISLGKYTNKEDVKLKLVFEDEKFSIKTPVFYYLDGDALHNAWQQLSKSQLKINRWDDAAVEGEIEVPESKNVLFTSIPFDSGWKAKVDGKEVPLKKIFNTFIGIDIPSGIHKVSFSYFPKGLISGIIISIISIIAATILILRTRKE